MELLRSQTSKTVLTLGLLSGAFILFTGAVGMIAAFHEREVVDNFISLGQLLLLLAPFIAAFAAANRVGAAVEGVPTLLVGGIVIGLLTAIPTLILLLFNSDEFRYLLGLTLRLIPFVAASYFAWRMYRNGTETQTIVGIWLLIAVLVGIVTFSLALVFEIKGDLRSVLVNIDRDWVDVVTFDNRDNLMQGIGTLSVISIVAGFAGSFFYVIPTVPRRALLYGLGVYARRGRIRRDRPPGAAGKPRSRHIKGDLSSGHLEAERRHRALYHQHCRRLPLGDVRSTGPRRIRQFGKLTAPHS